MRVTIHRDGGMLGRRVGGRVDTTSLPPGHRDPLESALSDPGRLRRAAGVTPPAGAADVPTYEVTIPSGHFVISALCGDADLVAALEAAVRETGTR
jgi:hypothetical protein